jgi:3-oxoacyl-[acyl-carrier protein] reductase
VVCSSFSPVYRVDSVTTPATALRDKTLLVTGASSGIGRAIALAAAAAGADVAITWRGNRSGADDTAAAIQAAGRKAYVLQLDLGAAGALALLVKTLDAGVPSLDAWINNAGADILTGTGGALSREEKLSLVLNVDLRGTVLASWAAVDYFRAHKRKGVIINMSWDHVVSGMGGENPTIYSAGKGGISSFSRSLAIDAAPDIRVNILAPGFIDTAFGETSKPEWRAHVERVTPLGRWGTPEDVAQAAVYLASDAAAFITGQTLVINGGVV